MIPKETPWYDSPAMHIFERVSQRLLSRDIDPIVAAYCGAVLDVAREYRIAAMGNGAAKIPDRPPPIRATTPYAPWSQSPGPQQKAEESPKQLRLLVNAQASVIAGLQQACDTMRPAYEKSHERNAKLLEAEKTIARLSGEVDKAERHAREDAEGWRSLARAKDKAIADLEQKVKAHERDYAAGNWKRVAEDRLARIEALEKDLEDLRIRNGGGVPS